MKHQITLIDSNPYCMQAIPVGYGWSKLGVWCNSTATISFRPDIPEQSSRYIRPQEGVTYLFLFL